MNLKQPLIYIARAEPISTGREQAAEIREGKIRFAKTGDEFEGWDLVNYSLGKGGEWIGSCKYLCRNLHLHASHAHTHRPENQHFAQRESAIEGEKERKKVRIDIWRKTVFEKGERLNQKVVALSHILSLSLSHFVCN